MKGRKPTPTVIRLASNNPGKRKLNRSEPRPEGKAPPCPDHFDAEERAEWEYLVGELGKMGTLASSDQGLMESYCFHVAMFRKMKRLLKPKDEKIAEVLKNANGNPVKNPVFVIARDARAAADKVCSELGLSPTSRARVTTDRPNELGKRERVLA